MISAKTVDSYFDQVSVQWQLNLMRQLRQVILSCGLKEEVKWGAPVYTHHGNVVGFGAFKKFVSVWFYEGALLADEAKVLVAANEKTQGLRQWRFFETDDLPLELFRNYVTEAALNMELGRVTEKLPPPPIQIPPDLAFELEKAPNLAERFEGYAKSKKRELIEHIESAKRSETRTARLLKVLALLNEGKSLNDKYRPER